MGARKSLPSVAHSWLLPKSTDVNLCSSAANYKSGAAAAITDQILVFLSFISLSLESFIPSFVLHTQCVNSIQRPRPDEQNGLLDSSESNIFKGPLQV